MYLLIFIKIGGGGGGWNAPILKVIRVVPVARWNTPIVKVNKNYAICVIRLFCDNLRISEFERGCVQLITLCVLTFI